MYEVWHEGRIIYISDKYVKVFEYCMGSYRQGLYFDEIIFKEIENSA